MMQHRFHLSLRPATLLELIVSFVTHHKQGIRELYVHKILGNTLDRIILQKLRVFDTEFFQKSELALIYIYTRHRNRAEEITSACFIRADMGRSKQSWIGCISVIINTWFQACGSF